MDKEKVQDLHDKLEQLRNELRNHGSQTEDAACAALCETSAEVLGGLTTAFEHYQSKGEAAWQK